MFDASMPFMLQEGLVYNGIACQLRLFSMAPGD
jgi:hypothetical protein